MKLALFAVSGDCMRGNAVLDALRGGPAGAARRAWERLTGEYPADDTAPILAVLISAIENVPTARLVSHPALVEARRVLADEIAPAARRQLGEQSAGAWQVPCWRTLAQHTHSLQID